MAPDVAKGATTLAILLVVVPIIVFGPCAGRKAVAQLQPGSVVALKAQASGAVSVDAYDRLFVLRQAGDSTGEALMRSAGEVVILAPGTKVKVIDPYASALSNLAEVRVQSGPHSGRAVLVSNSRLMGK